MFLRKNIALALLFAIFIPSLLVTTSGARGQEGPAILIPGLQDSVAVVRDTFGVPHIYARNDHDVYFMMGFLHAGDRFFQMDCLRRQASGKLAEILGPGPNDAVLNSDVNLRALGLRRAAERSLAAYSPKAIEVMQDYSNGVNAWLEQGSLPLEYSVLELTKANIPHWEVLDSISVMKAIAFQLSFDSSDLGNTIKLLTYQGTGQALGFDGVQLYFEDVNRSSPFDPTVSISPEQQSGVITNSKKTSKGAREGKDAQQFIQPGTVDRAKEFLNKTKDIPLFNKKKYGAGSNWWVVSGSKSSTGSPLMANDPHLALPSTPVFYENHLVVKKSQKQPGMDVYGVSFAGVPGIVQGFNERISWGSTVSTLDLTDFYQELVLVDPNNGFPSATLYQGNPEPLDIIPDAYFVNQVGDGAPDNIVGIPAGPRPSGLFVPPATFIVPRRNNGPIVSFGPGPAPEVASGLSIQYTGFSATHELDAFLTWARASDVTGFKEGLKSLTTVSQNWGYMDVDGNIAYFTSGEVPLREDLQAGNVSGLPPFFVRDGSGFFSNEWIRNDHPPAGQVLPYEILPFAEMPQIVNPKEKYIVNANNDPLGVTLDNNVLNEVRPSGQGIYYLGADFNGGYRIGQITKLIENELNGSQGDGRISIADMKRIQSNVQMLDAEVLTPYILQALQAGRSSGAAPELAALAGDAAVSQAVDRLANWDFSTPTGIVEGYDAADINGFRSPPSAAEIDNSVAATIYSVWRGQIIRNTIDATLQRVFLGDFLPDDDHSMTALRYLLDTFAVTHGNGASGLNFFDVPALNYAPEVERDIIILQSLKGTLQLLASDSFAPAFNNSTNQADYRWGKLHRIIFTHPFSALTPIFNIPNNAGFTDLSPALPGLSTDGGFEVIDASSHSVRADSANAFMFGGGPARRFVAEAKRGGIKAEEIIPGGESGVLGDARFGNMLGLWLTNEYHKALFDDQDSDENRVVYKPAN